MTVLTDNLGERDEKKYKKLQRKVETPELESDKMEQYSRRSNLIFSGIPETENEDTIDRIGPVIGSRYMARLPATGADWGLDTRIKL